MCRKFFPPSSVPNNNERQAVLDFCWLLLENTGVEHIISLHFNLTNLNGILTPQADWVFLTSLGAKTLWLCEVRSTKITCTKDVITLSFEFDNWYLGGGHLHWETFFHQVRDNWKETVLYWHWALWCLNPRGCFYFLCKLKRILVNHFFFSFWGKIWAYFLHHIEPFYIRLNESSS